MSDQQQSELEEYVGHHWYFRMASDQQQHAIEFPDKKNKTDASNYIAKMIGQDALPEGAEVSEVPFSLLDPLSVRAEPETPPVEEAPAADAAPSS